MGRKERGRGGDPQDLLPHPPEKCPSYATDGPTNALPMAKLLAGGPLSTQQKTHVIITQVK